MPESYEPLSSLDAAILGIEDKTNLMMASGVLTFARPLDIDKLKVVLKQRWLTQRRLRQRVVQANLPMAWPYWEEDPNFNLNAHVHRLALPAPGDRAMLQAFASDLVSTPLDFSKPLWQIHVIENYGEGGALLYRIHYVVGDGSALSALLMSAPGTAASSAPGTAASATTAVLTSAGDIPQIAKQAVMAAMLGRRLAKKLVIAGLDILSDPDKADDYVNKGVAYTHSSLQLALKVLEPETVFPNKLGVSKQVAWSRPFSITEIDGLRAALGGTLHDMMVTVIIGGVRRYMVAHDKPVNAARFRAAIPVNLRGNSGNVNLGHKFGLVFLSVPLAMADPRERLAEVRARMDLLKQSPDAQTVYNLVSAFSFIPSVMQNAVAKQVGVLASAVITNVAGPTEARYFAGQKIEESMFWAPQSARVGLGITIFSLANDVYVGINADRNVLPDPEMFVQAVTEEFREMRAVMK